MTSNGVNLASLVKNPPSIEFIRMSFPFEIAQNQHL